LPIGSKVEGGACKRVGGSISCRTDHLGNLPFGVWRQAHSGVGLGTPAEATVAAELIAGAPTAASER